MVNSGNGLRLAHAQRRVARELKHVQENVILLHLLMVGMIVMEMTKNRKLVKLNYAQVRIYPT